MKQQFFSKTFLLLLSFFSISSTFSQKITPGIRAGANVSGWNISGSSVTGLKTSSLTNAEFGMFVNFKTGSSFSIEPGILYTTAGSVFKYDGDENKTTFNLSYLQMPLLARYAVSKRFSLFAGPQAGFLLKATSTDLLVGKQEAKSLFKKNDFSIITGMQYNFPAGVGIGFKYATGITSIYSNGEQKIKNYSFGLNLSYEFKTANRK